VTYGRLNFATYPGVNVIEALFCVLCDAAVEENNRITITGAPVFAVRPPKLPARYPKLTVATALVVPWEEATEQISVEIQVANPSGTLLTIPEEFLIEPERDINSQSAPLLKSLVVSFTNLLCEVAGVYTCTVRANNATIAHADFHVVEP
jgi:hypothetical protein